MLAGSGGSPAARCTRQYLITEHSKYQHHQRRENQDPVGNIFMPVKNLSAGVILTFLTRTQSVHSQKAQ